MADCDWFVIDGICDGVHWCAYSDDLEACPNGHRCGILEHEVTEAEIQMGEDWAKGILEG